MSEAPDNLQGEANYWLRAAVDQRVAYMKERAGLAWPLLLASGKIIATTLTDPGVDQSIEDWERQCDHCSNLIPIGEYGYKGEVLHQLENSPSQLVFIAKFCVSCAQNAQLNNN